MNINLQLEYIEMLPPMLICNYVSSIKDSGIQGFKQTCATYIQVLSLSTSQQET